RTGGDRLGRHGRHKYLLAASWCSVVVLDPSGTHPHYLPAHRQATHRPLPPRSPRFDHAGATERTQSAEKDQRPSAEVLVVLLGSSGGCLMVHAGESVGAQGVPVGGPRRISGLWPK